MSTDLIPDHDRQLVSTYERDEDRQDYDPDESADEDMWLEDWED